MSRGARVLYLSYDGMTDPLGQSQVLPYLKALAAAGHDITIISCEKMEARKARGAKVAAECAAAGIDWQPIAYSKSPPVASSVWDLFQVRKRAISLQRDRPFDIVHCRSYLTAIVGMFMKRRCGTRFLFDMRGFWIDERFERGIWNPASPIYRLVAAWLRRRETQSFQQADAVVSLTHAAREELRRRGGEHWAAKTRVIPCCTDLAHFNPRGGDARAEGRAALGLPKDAQVLMFLGSLGGAYPLEPVFAFFRHWSQRYADARLLFITRHPPSDILGHASAEGLSERIIVRSGERADMPALIAAADAGLSFILPSFAAIGSSPTKVGEMLAMGVPVAANAGVGDMARILTDPSAGVLLPDLGDQAIHASAKILGNSSTGLGPRAVAKEWFALNSGVASYDAIYRELITVHSDAGKSP